MDALRPDGDYCLSERIPERCSYNGNIPIVAVVIVCNAIKAAVMLLVAFGIKGGPLITIGDAVESFLQHPDETTKGMSLANREQIENEWSKADHEELQPQKPQTTTLLSRQRWSEAASRKRWLYTMGLLTIALLAVTGLLAWACEKLRRDYNLDIISVGFAKPSAVTVINGWAFAYGFSPAQQVVASVLVANVPQLILSFLYLNLNGLLTSIFSAMEWSDFVLERKTLRVSNPKGAQRSTYFLQLPYKMGVPLIVVSGLLHWLVSQSIFLVVVARMSLPGLCQCHLSFSRQLSTYNALTSLSKLQDGF